MNKSKKLLKALNQMSDKASEAEEVVKEEIVDKKIYKKVKKTIKDGTLEDAKKFKHNGRNYVQLTSAGFNARGSAARGGKMGSHFWARDESSGKRTLLHQNVLGDVDNTIPPFAVNEIVTHTTPEGHTRDVVIKEVTQAGPSIKYKVEIQRPKEEAGKIIVLTQDDHQRMLKTSG